MARINFGEKMMLGERNGELQQFSCVLRPQGGRDSSYTCTCGRSSRTPRKRHFEFSQGRLGSRAPAAGSAEASCRRLGILDSPSCLVVNHCANTTETRHAKRKSYTRMVSRSCHRAALFCAARYGGGSGDGHARRAR